MTVEWYTPPDIVDRARALMGGTIELDPATCALAQDQIQAERYYVERDDGLSQGWVAKTVLLNPPGGRIGARSAASLWWDKLVRHYKAGEIGQAVFVGFNLEILRTAQASDPSPLDFPFCIPRNRIKFGEPSLGEIVYPSSPNRANVIVYLPPRPVCGDQARKRMIKHFGEVGGIVADWTRITEW